MEDIDDKIYKTLATEYGYYPDSAKQVCQFVKYLHHFAQYVGAHKYYSDTLNKRVALLTLDADMLALQSERARLESEQIYAEMEVGSFAKKPPDLKKRINDFKATLDSVNKGALELHSTTVKLMKDIKAEYAHSDSPASLQ